MTGKDTLLVAAIKGKDDWKLGLGKGPETEIDFIILDQIF